MQLAVLVPGLERLQAGRASGVSGSGDDDVFLVFELRAMLANSCLGAAQGLMNDEPANLELTSSVTMARPRPRLAPVMKKEGMASKSKINKMMRGCC